MTSLQNERERNHVRNRHAAAPKWLKRKGEKENPFSRFSSVCSLTLSTQTINATLWVSLDWLTSTIKKKKWVEKKEKDTTVSFSLTFI